MKTDLALLFLRLAAGAMMLGHGYGKVTGLLAGRANFPDPLGLGPVPSLAFAAFAEFGCALLVMIGFKTRWTAIPVVVTMLVAALVHHADDPWGDKEFPLLYASVFLTFVLAGGGRYTLDRLLGKAR